MPCRHNYVYTQGYFVCTKCGRRSYGKSSGRGRGKKIGASMAVAMAAGLVIFAFSSGIFEINPDNLNAAIDGIPSEIPVADIQVPDMPSLDEVKKIMPAVSRELQENTDTPKATKPDLDIPNIETLIHQMINEQRQMHGLTLLDYDDQISVIARSHSQDMAENSYFEHMSPDGKEPWDRGLPYGYETCGTPDAVALQAEYDELSMEYDKYPQISTSQSQHQQAMSIYNKLNDISIQLNSMSENGQLFDGLAENIFQAWTYDAVTYVGGVPVYDFNTDEDIARQVVDGWMDSPGHRANILSGFHSEGIGIALAPDDRVYVTQNFC